MHSDGESWMYLDRNGCMCPGRRGWVYSDGMSRRSSEMRRWSTKMVGDERVDRAGSFLKVEGMEISDGDRIN
jgi:hypothetical protein